jgi:hypothetical protein
VIARFPAVETAGYYQPSRSRGTGASVQLPAAWSQVASSAYVNHAKQSVRALGPVRFQPQRLKPDFYFVIFGTNKFVP